MSNIDKRAESVSRIIADLKLKHGSGDTYAPIMRWDELLALLDELEAVENRIAEVESQRRMAFMACNRWADKFREAEKRIAELEASHGNLREAVAGIHNTITGRGDHTPLAAILNASKRAYEESAAAAGKGV